MHRVGFIRSTNIFVYRGLSDTGAPNLYILLYKETSFKGSTCLQFIHNLTHLVFSLYVFSVKRYNLPLKLFIVGGPNLHVVHQITSQVRYPLTHKSHSPSVHVHTFVSSHSLYLVENDALRCVHLKNVVEYIFYNIFQMDAP